MPSLDLRRQADLFAPPEDLFDPAPSSPTFMQSEPPPPDFLARIRAEINATLARAETAEALPWPDLTAATLAELRFRGILHWLSAEEAAGLRTRFEVAMHRLYAAAGEA